MANELRIADDLTLPIDAVTETFLIFGKRGSGKTSTGTVLAEELIGAGLPVCVLDPKGDWWGLRSSADGLGPGLPVMILGGEHADLPLPPGSGAAVAEMVAAERLPVVLDMLLMSKTQQRTFVADFMERLYRANREPLHLIVDEADRYAPQRGDKDVAPRLIGAYEDIVLRGRKFGIGSTSITLRPAQLHSAIRSQVEVLIAMKLLGKLDVQAIDDWVRLHATEEEARELKASLPSLPVGTGWFWSPGWLEIMAKVHVRARKTFDSSATPRVGQQVIVPRQFAAVNPADLERLGTRLQAVTPAGAPGRAPGRPAADTGHLSVELGRLRVQLAEALQREPERVEVPVLAPGDIAALEQAVAGLRDLAGGIELALSRVTAPARVPTVVPKPVARPAIAPAPRAEPPAATGDMTLGKAQRAILTVLAQFPEGRTKNQIATLSGYSVKSSTFANNLSSLRMAGLITRTSPVMITPDGTDALGEWEALPSGAALVEHWMGRLSKSERAILRALLGAWPAPLGKEQIEAASGYSATSSTFSNALSRLRTLELISGYGEMLADEILAQAAREDARA